MFCVYVILVFGLVHHCHLTPPSCQDLLRPVDPVLPQHVSGGWTLVAGGLNTSDFERFKVEDSILLNFTVINGTSMSFSRASRFSETCQYVDSVITLEGSGFHFSQVNLTVIFMHSSCPDCLVLSFERQDRKSMPLYLFSRRRNVEKSEMDDFKQQAECLKKPHVAVMNPTKELCPELNNQTTQALKA
ncbi:unnamed protein product [Knipowitschia caucasica]